MGVGRVHRPVIVPEPCGASVYIRSKLTVDAGIVCGGIEQDSVRERKRCASLPLSFDELPWGRQC
jgi:hypothetical protein